MLRKNNSGFTLIEMMIGVVIAGIIASLAAPSFQEAWTKQSFKAGNRAIVSSLRLARSEAISKRQPFGVKFDDQASTVTVFLNSSSPAAMTFESSDSVITADTLPPAFSYLFTDFTNGVIIFQPNGSASFQGAGNIMTYAETSGMIASFYTSILASTGRVSTHSSYYNW